jgi:hypothetical protein
VLCAALYEIAAARDNGAGNEAVFLNTFNCSAIAFTNKIQVTVYLLVVCNYGQFSVSAPDIALCGLVVLSRVSLLACAAARDCRASFK